MFYVVINTENDSFGKWCYNDNAIPGILLPHLINGNVIDAYYITNEQHVVTLSTNLLEWIRALHKCQNTPPRDLHDKGIPIPYTRCRRGGKGCMRHPKTMRSIRDITFSCDVDNIQYRQGTRALPTLWDDLFRSDWNHRSWKRHRKNQFKHH